MCIYIYIYIYMCVVREQKREQQKKKQKQKGLLESGLTCRSPDTRRSPRCFEKFVDSRYAH